MKRGLLFLFVLLVGVFPAGAQGGPTIFPGLVPEDAFYVVVQYNNGADYRLYEYDAEAGSICDHSRPDGVRQCGLDLTAFLRLFMAIPVEEYLPKMPAGIVWEFNWDTWETQYTPVLIAMDVRTWDAQTDTSHRWWFAASVIDEHQTFAYISNRYDHFNYILVDTQLIQPLIGQVAE